MAPRSKLQETTLVEEREARFRSGGGNETIILCENDEGWETDAPLPFDWHSGSPIPRPLE